MSLDIQSKSGLHFHIGYGQFTFMRQECCNQVLPGLAAVHDWVVFGNQFLSGFKYKPNNDPESDLAYDIPGNVSRQEFTSACNELLYTYFRSIGMKAFWELFICHSDCDGKLTAKQCQRLVKDLDRIEPGPLFGEKFKEFRELVREAASRNETLLFG